MKSLEDKISNNETELQKAYDLAKYEKEQAEIRITRLKAEIECLEDTVLEQQGIIDLCKRRANEQGHDISIFNN